MQRVGARVRKAWLPRSSTTDYEAEQGQV